MKTRTLGLFLMVAGACAFGAGCGSSSTPATGTGGKGGGAGTGAGGAGTGGKATGGTGAGGSGTGGSGAGGSADAGAGGAKADAGTDVAKTDAGGDVAADAPVDAPADGGDAGAPATFTQVFNQILNNRTLPTADTSPGCANCHDGIPVDGGTAGQTIAHSINYLDKAAAYIALVGTAIPAVGVDSLRCPAGDAGAAVKRVLPGNPDESVLVQKLRQGRGIGTACDKVGMPINIPLPGDGGADAGFTQHGISQAELDLVVAWVTAGALNN